MQVIALLSVYCYYHSMKIDTVNKWLMAAFVILVILALWCYSTRPATIPALELEEEGTVTSTTSVTAE